MGRERERLVRNEFFSDAAGQEARFVANGTRSGRVQGVEVDFSHPSLASGEWAARDYWFIWGNTEQHCGIIFPDEAKVPMAELRRSKDGVGSVEAIYAEPGDKLTVEHVQDQLLPARDFDHPHDRIVKLASLVLTKVDGSVFRPASPMAFYGDTQFRDTPDIDGYDRLAIRILREAGWPDPFLFETDRSNAPGDRPDLNARALDAIGWAERGLAKLLPGLTDEQKSRVASILGNVAEAGFLQAKAEVRSAEKTAAKTLSNLAEGPRSQKDWDRQAEATRIWEENPTWSRTRVAKEVVSALGLNADAERSVIRSLRDHKLDPKRIK